MTVQAVLNKWIESIERRDLAQVLALYATDAVLIPTFSDTIRDSHDKIRIYFERVMQRQGLQIALHGKTLREQRLPQSGAILSGIYTWKFLVEEELITYEARFSFVMDLSAAAPILHHHSSQIPRMV